MFILESIRRHGPSLWANNYYIDDMQIYRDAISSRKSELISLENYLKLLRESSADLLGSFSVVTEKDINKIIRNINIIKKLVDLIHHFKLEDI